MSDLVLPRDARLRMLTKNFGPRASNIRVKVTYHAMVRGRAERSNWATMSHEEYFTWLALAPAKGLVLEKVEQLRD